MSKLSEQIDGSNAADFAANAEFYKFLLDERKDRREDYWSKRLLPWLVGALIPVLSALLTYFGVVVQRNETERQAASQRIAESTKAQTDNARLALEIYVKNPDFFEKQSADSLFHLKMIAAICDNAELKSIFAERYGTYVADQVSQGNTVVSVVQSLPDRFVSNIDYASFIAYVQAIAKPDRIAKGNEARDLLKSKGMKVADLDSRIKQAPSVNEVRYYKSEQATFATDLASQLQDKLREKFVAQQIVKPNLPNGIIEVWIATDPPGP